MRSAASSAPSASGSRTGCAPSAARLDYLPGVARGGASPPSWRRRSRASPTLRDFGRFAARRSRALPDDGVVVAGDAAACARRSPPPLGSLMSPRFNVDYRVAARDALLPPSPRRVQPMGLEALLRLISALCDEKLKADERAEATNTPLPPLLDLLHERIVRSHGLRSIADRKVAALREACATHGGHARIPLFSKIAHLDADDDDAWAEYKAHPPPRCSSGCASPAAAAGAAAVARRGGLQRRPAHRAASHKGVSVVESHSRRADGTAATELPLAAGAILPTQRPSKRCCRRGEFARCRDILGDAAALGCRSTPPLPRRKTCGRPRRRRDWIDVGKPDRELQA